MASKKVIGRVTVEKLNSSKVGGRKHIISPTKLKNGINKYFKKCEETERVPSVKGLMLHFKMPQTYFYRFLEYPELADIMSQAKLIIEEWCENDIYTTTGSVAGKLAYMKNVHNWTDKVETKTEIKQEITIDEAKARIEMLAPKLLEILAKAGALPTNMGLEAPNKAIEAIYEENTPNGMDNDKEEVTEPIPFDVETNPRRVVR